MNDEDKDTMVFFLQKLKIRFEEEDPIIDYKVKMLDERKKVPRTKAYLHYFAGKSDNHIFMGYQPDEEG
jgi:hypothetical protein